MSPPISPSTLEAPGREILPGGAGSPRSSLDHHLGLEDSVVWEAVGLLAPVVSAETERRFKFRGMPQAVGAARRVLRAWEAHFEPDLFYDLSLCISELVTNRVRHGAAPAGEEIELVVRRGEQFVRVEVRERRSQDLLLGSQPTESISDGELFIVDRIADRWGLEHGEGTVAWCEIDLASDGWSRNSSRLPAR
jgi:anti-sigma regulatory factor (Ser/Thr protein kinase)